MNLNKLIVAIIVVITTTSCGTGMRVAENKLKEITPTFNGVFENVAFQKSKNNRVSNYDSLLLKFNIYDTISDSVKLHFISEDALKVSYKDSLGEKSEIFEGKFHKKGYFEIFLSKERIEFPPIFPILFSRVDVDRIRINVTKEGNLLVDNFYERGGNIFILAGGYSQRDQCYFKKI